VRHISETERLTFGYQRVTARFLGEKLNAYYGFIRTTKKKQNIFQYHGDQKNKK
jgi:hypothetical protein